MKKVVELASSAANIQKKKPKHDPDADMEFMEETMNNMLLSLPNAKIQQVKSTRQFRTSSLPFCPILEFIKDPSIEEYAKSHYTTTGTAIHETVQSWLAVNKLSQDMIYGSWKCTGCKKIKLNQLRPKKLCDCSHTVSTTEFHRGWPKHWTYEEIEYNYHGLTGHIDLVVAPRPDFYFVTDFKTTELQKKKLRSGWKQDKVSSPNYVAQIRTYSTILTLEHKLPIRGWMLVNLDRGAPIRKASDFHPQVAAWSQRHSERWDKYLKHSIDNNKILQKLERAVEDQDKETATSRMKMMVKTRPCRSQHDYDSYMRYKFYGDTECPLKDVCLNGSDKSVRNKIISELAKKE